MSEKRILIMDLDSGRTNPVREEKPLLSSASAGRNGFLLEEIRAVDREVKNICWITAGVALNLDTPLSLEWRSERMSFTKRIAPGQISILPARLPFSARSCGGGRVVLVSLEQSFLLSAAAEMGGLEGMELACRHGIDDPLIRELVLGLRAEVQNPRPGGHYLDSLATMLATHLTCKHSVHRQPIGDQRGGLTKFQLTLVIEFVQQHLADNISLEDLAGMTGLSYFHFARMFKKSAGMAPHQFVIRSRVMRARELLLNRNARLADVAAQVGFCDQSHLAAHFKRIYGVSPIAYVQGGLHRKNIL